MKFSETFTSVTKTYVNFDVYLPTVMIRYKAIIQIHHAMGEHLGRYQRFAEYLAHDGFVVVVSDFPGHGMSLYNYEQGYFGDGDATKNLVEDMQRLRNMMAARYPDLPYFMIGNELGSIVLRKYVANYGDYVQGCVFMGTCGKLRHINLGKAFVKGEVILRGNMYRSKLIKKAIVKCETYITSDLNELELYHQDPFTDFIYTNQAYNDILKLIKEVTLSETIKKIPDYLSVFIVSGLKDSFGRFGKGPKWLYDNLLDKGVKDLSLKLYENSHQDILHDCQRLEVYKDILEWLNERTFI
ncbi:alpha/beta fold hydrolase [Thomasclavelia cocleata]|jgi:alpha-beta hydrolase superfamily lysophospholipase|uniref:alpha/beta fold hydrolase n=1 Tax=Thomasclavelia cocleata TaxID=69824 RepID=UPI002420485F|nr:alpha/beta fold hydrolase [Thomasclavelia cocleata]MCI9630088.1 alpha/beta hydrolase [Thomasclavelia cocleata]